MLHARIDHESPHIFIPARYEIQEKEHDAWRAPLMLGFFFGLFVATCLLALR